MGAKKRTKPIIPGREKAALALAKIRIHKYKDKYATLWVAAKEFIKTKEYRYIIKIAKKQMVIKHGVGYYRTFRKDKNRQIKFVLNMFRDIKKVEEEYLTFHPKALYQTEETGFTPPKDLIRRQYEDNDKEAKRLGITMKEFEKRQEKEMKKNEKYWSQKKFKHLFKTYIPPKKN